ITMCMFSQQLQAQPLYVNNNSDIGDFPYDITTYLIYSRAGEVCSGHDWALPFTFEAGSMLTINDGSFVWQNNLCISEPIGYGCEPVPIEFYGQRINNILYDVTNPEDYVLDRKSTRLNSSHVKISYAVFCLKKKIECRSV